MQAARSTQSWRARSSGRPGEGDVVQRPLIHLIAPAGVCRPFLDALGMDSARGLVQMIQELIGSHIGVRGDETLIEAVEDERRGGRNDDAHRAGDIEEALADDAVRGVVAVRGGAWFTRVLPLIDFSVLEGRTQPIAVFGFSELTTLVNIVGGFDAGRGVYDMGPAFLTYGLKRYATMQAGPHAHATGPPAQWVDQRLRLELETFFRDVASMMGGRGSSRPVEARVLRGSLPDRFEARVVGGNLTVLSAMVGSAYDRFVRPNGRWLLIEDFNDKLERIDRFLAHLTLAGYWDQCAGILLGDFHKGYEDLTASVLALLPHHLPRGRSIPLLHAPQIGHTWPMAPIPLNRAITVERAEENTVALTWPGSDLQTV
jgi:muramoyltetrapeptide carboxypeptidase